jgi:hypothetical protein
MTNNADVVYNRRMVIELAPYLRKRRNAAFIALSRYFREQGCSFSEAARFAKQTMAFGHHNAKVIPYGSPPDLPH